MKRSISTQISTSAIDDIYAQARYSGALGGKLAGAGGVGSAGGGELSACRHLDMISE